MTKMRKFQSNGNIISFTKFLPDYRKFDLDPEYQLQGN